MEIVQVLIASNIKRLRKESNLSIEALAELCGVSKSMLSQIEKGEANPSVSTLWKISEGMKVPFEALVERPQVDFAVVRKEDLEPHLRDEGRVRTYFTFPDKENRRFSICYVEVEPGGTWESEAHLKALVEYITVFSGEVEIHTGRNVVQLKPGESVQFQADVKHSYKNTGKTMAVFHVVLYYPQIS